MDLFLMKPKLRSSFTKQSSQLKVYLAQMYEKKLLFLKHPMCFHAQTVSYSKAV